MFPNYIPHGVSSNRYVTPRISIAGDIRSSTWKDDPNMVTANVNKNLVVKIGTCGSK